MQLTLFHAICSAEGCGETYQPNPKRVYPMCPYHAQAARQAAYRERNPERARASAEKSRSRPGGQLEHRRQETQIRRNERLLPCPTPGCDELYDPVQRRTYQMCPAHGRKASIEASRERNREELNRRAREKYDPDAQRARWAKYSAQNREHLAARGRDWSRSAEGKASQARYYERNREARLAANRQWRGANRERRREAWKVYGAARRARKQQAPGDCSRQQWQARWEFYGGKCWVCRADADSIDHIIPLARGGSNWPSNLRPACRKCNSAKGARSWRLYARKEAA